MEKVSQGKIKRTVRKKTDEPYHTVNSITFENDVMTLAVDNAIYTLPLKMVSKKLMKASDKEREAYKVICSGYGISWPLIDEDLSIDGLIKRTKQIKD
jgi:hypothetical protein